jgi:hypothetical protein
MNMIEECGVEDFGGSEHETMQTAPGGPHIDSLYGRGWTGGLQEG